MTAADPCSLTAAPNPLKLALAQGTGYRHINREKGRHMGWFRKSDTEKQPTFSPQDRANIRWFWDNYLKEKAPALFGVLLLVISQGFVYQQFLSLTDRSLRIIFQNGELSDLIWVCAMVFAVFMFRGAMSFLVPRLSALISSSAVMKMRHDLINHLMTLDLAFFDRTTPGEFILRLVQQAESLTGFVGQTTMRAVRDASTLIIVSIYLFSQQPLLFSIAALVIPVLILVMQRVTRRIKDIQVQSQQAIGDYMGSIDEVVSAMRTVKMSNQTAVESARLHQATTGLRTLTVRLQTAQAMAQPFVDFAAAFVYVLVIGGGGYVVLSPAFDTDGASIITFLLGLVLIFDPGRRLAQFWAQLQSTLVILDGLRSLHQVSPTITDAPDATDDFDPAGDMALQDVSFGYTPEQVLFDGINMAFEGGKSTAIVGTTGSGKTTILALLARLYDPTSGQILIGDTPIKHIKQSALRDTFSVVAQDVVIFNASIYDNIRYVRPDATDADVRAAADAAEISDLMDRRGETPVGPKGAQLSGGQRQRIGIARAFLRSAPIVFLDEATSALDQQTEEKVKRALDRLSQGRTTVMVAHKLSSVMDVDRIYVMENGQVVETGTHVELMGKGGLYQSLFMAQQKNYAG